MLEDEVRKERGKRFLDEANIPIFEENEARRTRENMACGVLGSITGR